MAITVKGSALKPASALLNPEPAATPGPNDPPFEADPPPKLHAGMALQSSALLDPPKAVLSQPDAVTKAGNDAIALLSGKPGASLGTSGQSPGSSLGAAPTTTLKPSPLFTAPPAAAPALLDYKAPTDAPADTGAVVPSAGASGSVLVPDKAQSEPAAAILTAAPTSALALAQQTDHAAGGVYSPEPAAAPAPSAQDAIAAVKKGNLYGIKDKHTGKLILVRGKSLGDAMNAVVQDRYEGAKLTLDTLLEYFASQLPIMEAGQ